MNVPQSSNTQLPEQLDHSCADTSAEIKQIWEKIQQEAQLVLQEGHELEELVHDIVLNRADFPEALCVRLARRLSREDMPREKLEAMFRDILQEHPQVAACAAKDLQAIRERDPACQYLLEPLLFFKGFLALSSYRFAHVLWGKRRYWLALYLQSIISEAFSVDIHPAARIGSGILLDHATSFVVGETAIIENNVSILHEVTLGGTGKECGDRHPIIRSGVLIGAGAKILGRVEIGEGAKIGAGSVVLHNVPSHTTVAGVPAVIVNKFAGSLNPADIMDQHLE